MTEEQWKFKEKIKQCQFLIGKVQLRYRKVYIVEKVSIPYRQGTTYDGITEIIMNDLIKCQFLIGKVQQ